MLKLTLAVVLLAVIGSVFCQRNRDTRQETTCQTHQRNTGGARAFMNWDIKCDENGHYLPLQCIKETPKWCACYNKEESITQPSRSTKNCECHLKRKEVSDRTNNPCEIPICDRSGKFEKKQCCPTTQKCRCVHPTTGVETTAPTANMNLQCM